MEPFGRRIKSFDPLHHQSVSCGPHPRSAFARALKCVRTAIFVVIGCGTLILAYDVVSVTPAISSVTPTAEIRPAWIEVTRASGAFAVSMQSLDASQSSYLVRRHREGNGRKDLMTFGAPNEKGVYARVELYRPGTEGEAVADPLDAVAALASESKINAELSETRGKLKTKFGDLAVIDMQIAGDDGSRACAAVAGAWDDPRLGLVAWLCNPGPELVSHGQLACLVDRLTMMSAGGDDKLGAFFAKAELKRNFCGVAGPILAATPKRPDDWISQKAAPPLRGRITGR